MVRARPRIPDAAALGKAMGRWTLCLARAGGLAQPIEETKTPKTQAEHRLVSIGRTMRETPPLNIPVEGVEAT
jgi:hypothetical protein